ncbi:MAG: hypothetical protein Q4E12_06810 [Coriobacteriia bacterium]|nr:hypothetical protein [Coriobacteriia bacterium]
MLEPAILLMDEPFAAVDPATKRRMCKTIEGVREAFGCTMVFVTHDFYEA